MNAPINIIPATEAHERFILDSFVREYSKAPYARGATWKRLADQLKVFLACPSWDCDVAVAPEDPDEIMGYLIHRGTTCAAWLHVKSIYRTVGVARALLDYAQMDSEVLCQFVTPKAIAIATANGMTLRFRPMLHYAALDEIEELATVSETGKSNERTA